MTRKDEDFFEEPPILVLSEENSEQMKEPKMPLDLCTELYETECNEKAKQRQDDGWIDELNSPEADEFWARVRQVLANDKKSRIRNENVALPKEQLNNGLEGGTTYPDSSEVSKSQLTTSANDLEENWLEVLISSEADKHCNPSQIWTNNVNFCVEENRNVSELIKQRSGLDGEETYADGLGDLIYSEAEGVCYSSKIGAYYLKLFVEEYMDVLESMEQPSGLDGGETTGFPESCEIQSNADTEDYQEDGLCDPISSETDGFCVSTEQPSGLDDEGTHTGSTEVFEIQSNSSAKEQKDESGELVLEAGELCNGSQIEAACVEESMDVSVPIEQHSILYGEETYICCPGEEEWINEVVISETEEIIQPFQNLSHSGTCFVEQNKEASEPIEPSSLDGASPSEIDGTQSNDTANAQQVVYWLQTGQSGASPEWTIAPNVRNVNVEPKQRKFYCGNGRIIEASISTRGRTLSNFSPLINYKFAPGLRARPAANHNPWPLASNFIVRSVPMTKRIRHDFNLYKRRNVLKPPFTYAELIELVLYEEGPRTVPEIYFSLSGRFKFFQTDDTRWKNSVRHCLTVNALFKKSERGGAHSSRAWSLAGELDYSKAIRTGKRIENYIRNDLNLDDRFQYEAYAGRYRCEAMRLAMASYSQAPTFRQFPQ